MIVRRTILGLSMAAGIALGIGVGVSGFTFIYAKGASYLTNDPRACANCHVMQEQYDGWRHSSHRNVATCNDCHTPHDFIGKYMTKASNGYHHSMAFTLGNFHEPIQIKEHNAAITERACRSCHSELTQEIDHYGAGTEEMSCVRCHRSVGHQH